jgi:uncharacterized protein
MKYILILIIGIQFSLSGQKDNLLILQAKTSENVIHINWFPENQKAWSDLITIGYTVSRQTIDVDGKVLSESMILSNKVMRKDSAWFTKNNNLADGLMRPVKALLYDKKFDFPGNGEMSALDMKYNYLVYESTIRPVVADALGLGFSDSKTEKNKRYRYSVKSLDGRMSGSIDITNAEGSFVSFPSDYQSDFVFPEGKSLSEMQELSKPFVLNAIVGLGRPKLDSIILRWGPSTQEIWRNAMKDGYEIYRSSEGQDKKLIATVFPWNESKFRSIPLSDSLALLAASIVKEKGISPKVGKMDFYEQATMAANFFGFALFTADRSPLAADILGLRYVDKDVEVGKTYIYEINSKRLVSTFPLQDIIVANEWSPLLPPEGFYISRGEKSATLKWLTDSDLTNYSSYIVERSEYRDTLFQVLTDPPLVFLNDPTNPLPFKTFKDTLSENGRIYFYRVKGSNSFGEWSDYAEGHGAGVDLTPPVAVSLKSGTYDKAKKEISITWQENKRATDLKSYQVLLANDPDGSYSAVSPFLPLTDTSFVLKMEGMELDESFYFAIVSRDSSGNEARSIARFVNVPDLTPPLPPPAIKALIDSTGLVQVTWEDSPSKDAQGYWIYFTNSKSEEFTAINDYLYKGNSYTWNIPVNSLTKNLYVCVKAEDENYNKSDVSEIIKVRRPDKIPPVKAVMLPVEIEEDQIKLTWVESSSEDLVGYILYSKNTSAGDTGWITLDTLMKGQYNYTIRPDSFENYYNFCVKAFDDFDNLSDYSNHVQGKMPFPAMEYVVANVKASPNNTLVDLIWSPVKLSKQTEKIGFTYEIYKSSGESDPEFLANVSSAKSDFTDRDVKSNVLYNYAIRVKYDNGWAGELSEVKSLLIK